MARWLERHPINRKVAGSIPSQDQFQIPVGMCAKGNQSMFLSLSLSLSSPLSMSSGEDKKVKNKKELEIKLLYFVVCVMCTHVFVRTIHGIIVPQLLFPWYVIIISIYNAHHYFSLEYWGKKVCIIHSKTWYCKSHIYDNNITQQ